MSPNSISNQKVCISALNWGMGHVSRCISLINNLNKQHNSVYFAGSKSQHSVLKSYFGDQINYLELDDYPFKFKGKGNFGIDLLLNFKNLIKHTKYEYNLLDKWISDFNFDLVISDHRYGFYNKKITSIFITHQIHLPLPKALNWINYFHIKKLNEFNQIWVPDFPNRLLSGKLSIPFNSSKTYYIGPLSRFQLYDLTLKNHKNYTLVVVSGPDPYAKQFFEEQIKRFENKLDVTFIVPRKLNSLFENKNNLNLIYSENWKKTDSLFLNAKKIISRSGYSTYLDNFFLQKELETYPTKGQFEQEYLSKIHEI